MGAQRVVAHEAQGDEGVEVDAGALALADHVAVDRDCQFMELAVYSGRLAANAVLSEAGLPTAPILPDRRGPRRVFG